MFEERGVFGPRDFFQAAIRLLRRHDALALLNNQKPVSRKAHQLVHHTAGPVDFQPVDFRCSTEAEVDAQVILGKIAASAPNLTDLPAPTRLQHNPRSDSVAVRFRPHGAD